MPCRPAVPASAPPAVSVLLPARDAQATLSSALASVAAQSFADHEVVVVDDGSRDSTAAVARGFAERDPRIRLLRTAGLGIVGALNAGLAACRGALVARFDADDLMHRSRLERQVAALAAEPGLAGVGSLVRSFPRASLRDGMRRYEAWQNSLLTPLAVARERFVEAPVVHPSMTLRREVVLAAGGWRDTAWPEDWDLWLRLLEAGASLGKVPAVLHYWRDGAARLTRTHPRYSLEALTRARAHFLARGPLQGREAVLWGAGPVGKALMRALDAEGARVAAFVDIDPRKIGQRVHGRPVHGARGFGRSPGVVLLAAVGAPGAREEIRAEALARGFVEGEDFFACA